MTDKELIIGLRKGDYSSYESLFRLYYAKFVHYAESLVCDREIAKDIVQEAFIKIWTRRETLSLSSNIHNLLYVLVRNASLNFLRDKKVLESVSSDIPDEDDAPLPTDSIDQIRNIVEKMPRQRKTVFKLSREEGLGNKDIANQLKLSEKTVERHITLALSDIRNKFKS